MFRRHSNYFFTNALLRYALFSNLRKSHCHFWSDMPQSQYFPLKQLNRISLRYNAIAALHHCKQTSTYGPIRKRKVYSSVLMIKICWKKKQFLTSYSLCTLYLFKSLSRKERVVFSCIICLIRFWGIIMS